MVDVVDSDKADVDSIQRGMVGRNVDKEYYREEKQQPYDSSKVLLELTGTGVEGSYSNISLKLHAGEVLCLAGTEGSSREAILRTIFGL